MAMELAARKDRAAGRASRVSRAAGRLRQMDIGDLRF